MKIQEILKFANPRVKNKETLKSVNLKKIGKLKIGFFIFHFMVFSFQCLQNFGFPNLSF